MAHFVAHYFLNDFIKVLIQ